NRTFGHGRPPAIGTSQRVTRSFLHRKVTRTVASDLIPPRERRRGVHRGFRVEAPATSAVDSGFAKTRRFPWPTTLLRDHVTIQYRSIDRIFLQAYVPKLQAVGQVCTFLRWQRKFKIPSSAAFGQIGDAYVKD